MIRHQIIFDLNATPFEEQSDNVLSFLQETFGSAAVGCYAFFKTKKQLEAFHILIDAVFLNSSSKGFEVFLMFPDFVSVQKNLAVFLDAPFDQVQLFSLDSAAFESRFSDFCNDANHVCLEAFLTNEKCHKWLFIQDDVIEQVYFK